MGDKLVRLNAVINIAMQYCPDNDGSCSKADVDLREMLDELENLSPVEPPMSAVAYETALDMMEDSYDGFEFKKLWNEAIRHGFIEKAVAIVEAWAKEYLEGV